MKKIKLILLLMIATSYLLCAQPPQALKYKAVAKDEWGVALPNKDITLQFTILQDGAEVYRELHYTTTNKFGLMSADVGDGLPQAGTFPAIDWSVGEYTMKVELDTKGGLDFRLEGSERLLSVPYALFAGDVAGAGGNDDPNPQNELISDLYLSGTVLYIAEGTQTLMVDLWDLQDGVEDADADPTNELQDLSFVGTSLGITNGSTVDLGSLPDLVDDADADPLNEIQDLQLAGNILTITMNSMATEIDLNPYLDNTDTQLTEAEVDAMVANNGYLAGITWGDIPDVPPDLADGDDNTQLTEAEVDAMVDNNGYLTTESDDQTLSLVGQELSIEDGNTVILPDAVDDADADPTNELQDLSLADNLLSFSGDATPVDLSPYLDDTDTHLTEAEVDAMTDNNGYLTGLNWADIPDVPADLADGDDNTQLSEAEVDAMVNNNGYLTTETDGDPANELISTVILNGVNLEITDAAGTHTADLSALSGNGSMQTLSNVLAMGNDATGNNIINLADPINVQDAATKNYIDNLLIQIIETDKLVAAGYPVEQLLAGGHSIRDLLDAGVTISDLLGAGLTVSVLLAANISVADLLESGVTLSDLLAAGADLQELLIADVTVMELLNAGVSSPDLIGLNYEGGLIFYINESDGSGMVASPTRNVTCLDFSQDGIDCNSLPGLYSWNCFESYFGTSTDFGMGRSNTELVSSLCESGLIWTVGGHHFTTEPVLFFGKPDWYVPSRDELNLIRTNLYLQGIGEYEGCYTTSSEINQFEIWRRCFDDDDNYYTSLSKTDWDIQLILVRDFNE